MSLRINLDYDSSPLMASNLMGYGYSKEHALATDAFRILLTSLDATTQRLEAALVDFCKNTSQLPEAGFMRISALLVADAGSIVNDFHRIVTILTKVTNLQGQGPVYKQLIDDAKLVRHSLQHAEDRVSEYFIGTGDSILGDLRWSYRAVANERDCEYTIIAGVTIGSTTIPGRESPTVAGPYAGVYDVFYNFVAKRGKAVDRISISLDQVVKTLNAMITYTEQSISERIRLFERGNPDFEGIPFAGLKPMYFRAGFLGNSPKA
jgi:hypothetical protein